MPEHLLRRPFGIYDSQDDTFEILYQVIGPGTTLMSGLETGLSIEVMGPIGKAWNPPGHIDEALLVAGGVGSAPIYPLAKELVGRGVTVSVVLGASTAEALVSREKFGGLTGAEPMCATDDGTYGRAGFCSQIAEDLVDEAIRGDRMIDYIACCGPDPLMKKVGRMAIGAGIICELSLERRM
ncbi:MAG: dihydroorotate dehydrogenase electron transfer subunit, partial [Eggerthellaceae bacterium]|nr:dihydroorotate dehydrogenase electron transfer subunit [Eggerthellaceae bacterium]